ncbi:hypothetical protein [Paraclostridium sordellii]|uniref:hypothetical protein n=1 Tax=Paraclostridium sordellii TaxID=1505 RepID=UPI00070991D5|nr:hypothetical protein [Paeniclostridium sordellii]MDU1453163.1 hypothetical protein [Paeniclostridium sordellii]
MKKYSAEFGLNIYSSYKTVIPVEYLDMVQDGKKYHIYGILSVPKVKVNSDSINCDENGLSMEFIEIENGKEKISKIENFSEFPGLDYRKAKIQTKFPYGVLDIKFPRAYLKNLIESKIEPKFELNKFQVEEIINILNSPRDVQYIHNSQKSSIRMEVLYIGQAFGNNGDRTAIQRLKSHEKLQRILVDCNSKYPDKRIYILLLEMSPVLNTVFDGISKEFMCTEEETHSHIENVIKNKLEENQIINIAEAAMINYFKPKYNTNFIENFPNEKHKGYRQYYDLDYNSISIELDMSFDNHNIILYTETNYIKPFRYIKYNIFNDPNRADMYSIFKEE